MNNPRLGAKAFHAVDEGAFSGRRDHALPSCTHWSFCVQGSSTACTIGGLRAGCTYRVRVRAHNAAGGSPASAASDVRTAADVPDAPAAPVATAAPSHALELAWDPPRHNGGCPVQAYRLELSTGAGQRLYTLLSPDGHFQYLHVKIFWLAWPKLSPMCVAPCLPLILVDHGSYATFR